MAVKMYAWYFSLHPHSSSFDVRDDISDQVYKSGDISAYPTCTAAVDAVNGELITDENYHIFETQYWAGYNSPGRYGPPQVPTDGWLWQNGSVYYANQGYPWVLIFTTAYNYSTTDGNLGISLYWY